MMFKVDDLPCRSNYGEVTLYPPAWLKFKRLTIPSVDYYMEQLERSGGMAGGSKERHNHFGEQFGSF